MLNRRFFVEAATLILSAAFCALLANQFASRERKLNLPGGDPRPRIERRVTPTQPQPVQTTSMAVTDAAPSQIVPSPEQTQKPPQEPVAAPTVTRESRPSAPSPPRQFPPHPDKPWVEIDSASVRELYARGVPFIDARRTNVYEQGHIAGARSIPVWESDLDERLKALYEEGLDPEGPIVVYCSGGDCEDSHMLGERLWGIGFNNVLVYKDGYPDWLKHGGAVETGPKN